MKRKATGLFLAMLMVGSGIVGYQAHASQGHDGPTVYKLAHDLGSGMPYRLKLKHCAPAEDTLAVLKLVEYRTDVVVYRCRARY